MDQAILILRFPNLFVRMQQVGLAVSAIEFSMMSRPGSDQLRAIVAQKLDLDPVILQHSMQAMYDDESIRNIWRLWQTPDPES